MNFKNQVDKIKDNWLIILLVLAVLLVPGFLGIFTSSLSYGAMNLQKSYAGGYADESRSAYYPGIINNRDFAPDVKERKIMKTATMSAEVEKGSFTDEETRLKDIITASNSFLLNENVNKYGDEKNYYHVGYYSIKVEAPKYDSVLSQLKSIGEVKSFKEDKVDITGQYSNIQIELQAEKTRLDRYNSMYKEASLVADKITLSDKIFDQERTIKYMESGVWSGASMR